MRRPRSWYDWFKLAMTVLMIGFIAHWIFTYDACRRGANSVSPQAGCLVESLLSTYATWWSATVGGVLWLVTSIL